MDHTLKVLPFDIEVGISENQSMLAALKEAGIFIKSSCGGCASCTDCVIKVVEGDEFLNATGPAETKLLGNVFHITKERLSCQTKVFGNVTIDVTHHDEKAMEEERRKKQSRKVLLKKGGKQNEEIKKEAFIEKDPYRDGGFKRPKQFKYSDDD